MTKNNKITLFIVFLCCLTVFSVVRYAAAVKEKHGLMNTLNQVKAQVVILEKEKQNLLQSLEKEKVAQKKLAQDKLALKDYLKASKARLIRLFKAYASEKKAIGALKAENKILIRNRQELYKQNKAFKRKLSSVEELRKAIKEVDAQMQKYKTETLGNRGFIIKDGKPTCAAKIKIEVDPAPKN